METRRVETFLLRAILAGIILGRSAIFTNATGRTADLSGNTPFTLEGLRVDQRASLTLPKEPLPIVAGAGRGKTTLILGRIVTRGRWICRGSPDDSAKARDCHRNRRFDERGGGVTPAPMGAGMGSSASLLGG